MARPHVSSQDETEPGSPLGAAEHLVELSEVVHAVLTLSSGALNWSAPTASAAIGRTCIRPYAPLSLRLLGSKRFFENQRGDQAPIDPLRFGVVCDHAIERRQRHGQARLRARNRELFDRRQRDLRTVHADIPAANVQSPPTLWVGSKRGRHRGWVGHRRVVRLGRGLRATMLGRSAIPCCTKTTTAAPPNPTATKRSAPLRREGR